MTPTQRALPYTGDAMAQRFAANGVGSTANYLGGMRINAPISMSGGDATPQSVQMQLESMVQRGVQNFMNKAAA